MCNGVKRLNHGIGFDSAAIYVHGIHAASS